MTTTADTIGRSSWLDSGVTLVVAVVAAAASYGHMLHVAELAGEPLWIARAWPITVDGLAIAALRRGERGRWWLALALAVSVASNVLSGNPEMVETIAPAVKAWPPVALLGTHMLLHGHRQDRAATAPAPAEVVRSDDPASSLRPGAGEPGDDVSARRRRAPAPTTTRPRARPASTGGRRKPPVVDVVELVPAARRVADELTTQDQRVTRDALVAGMRAAGHQVSNKRAGELLALLRRPTSSSGAGAGSARPAIAALPAAANGSSAETVEVLG